MLNNNLDLVFIMNSLRASDKKSNFASFAFGAAVDVSHPCFQTRCIELARRTRVSREGTLLGKSHFMTGGEGYKKTRAKNTLAYMARRRCEGSSVANRAFLMPFSENMAFFQPWGIFLC